MGFNQAQKKAVTHGAGPCQVLAGPGSGKTLTIVNRITYLIEECHVRPEEILVVTFTRFAAAEMKERLSGLMGKKNIPVTAGTFHGIYYGILKWAYRFGPQNILSEEEKYQLLRLIIGRQELDPSDEEDFLKDIAEEIGKVKNNRIDIQEYVSSKCGAETFRDIYTEYEKERKSPMEVLAAVIVDKRRGRHLRCIRHENHIQVTVRVMHACRAQDRRRSQGPGRDLVRDEAFRCACGE